MRENNKILPENNNAWSVGNFLKNILDSIGGAHNLVKEAEEQRFFPINIHLVLELQRASEDSYEQNWKQSDIKIIEYDKEFEAILSEELDSDLPAEPEDPENIERFQRRLNEEIYFYLAFLLKEFAEDEENISFEEVMTYEMGRVLSLPADHPSILKLTIAFIEWMRDVKTFTAGWGTITYSLDDTIILKSLDEKKEVGLRVESAEIAGAVGR